MKAFGPAHANPDAFMTCPIPIGQKCLHCEEVFIDGDRGFVLGYAGPEGVDGEVGYHRECFLRSIFGSVGHQLGTCSCEGGHDEDPPGMTKREAARAAVSLFEKKNGYEKKNG